MKPHIRFGRLYLIEMVLNSGNNAFYGIFNAITPLFRLSQYDVGWGVI